MELGGADHTWFITPLLICYLLTPIVSVLYDRLSKDKKKMYLLVGVQVIIIPLVLVLIPSRSFFTVGVNIPFYILAYCIGRGFDNNKVTKKSGIGFMAVAMLSFAIRIIGKAFIDGTRMYDCIIVIFTQYIAAFCILGIFAGVFKNLKKSKMIDFICGISFEIYLCHYMFIVGPVSLMGLTSSYLLNCSIVVAISIVVAFTMNKLGELVKR